MGMGKKKKKHKKKDKHEGDKGENEGGEQPDAGGEPKEEGQDKGSDHGAEDKEAKPAEGEGAPEEAAPEAAPAEGGKEESKPEGKAAETASDAGSVEKAEGAGDKASDSAAAAPEKKSKKKKRKSFSKELRDGSRYSGKVPPLHNYTLDFTCLTEEEEKMLRTVVEKDEAEMRPTMEFVRLLNHEMDLLRYRGMGVEGQKPKCLRCRKKYGWWRKLIPIIDQGKRCMICQFKACPGCRYKQANGKYLCGICVRRREIKMLTGEWLEPPATRLHSTELIKVSLRDKDKYQLLHAAREKKKNDLLQKLNALHSRRKSQNVALGGFNLWKSAKKGKKSKKKKKDKKGKKEKKDKEKKKKKKKKKDKEKSNNATSELVDLDTNMSFLSSAIRCVEGESFTSGCETTSVLTEGDEEQTSQSNDSSGTCTMTETVSKQGPSRRNKRRVSFAADEEEDTVTEDAEEEEYDESDYDEDLYEIEKEDFNDNEEDEEEYDLDDRYYNDGSEGYSGDNCFPEGRGEYDDYYCYYEGEGYSDDYNYNDDDDYYDDASKEDYCCSENRDNQTYGKGSNESKKRQTTIGELIVVAESKAAGIRSKEKLDIEMKSDQLYFEQDKERTDHRKGKDQGTKENRRLKRKHKESYHGGSSNKHEGKADSDAPSMKVCRAAQQGMKACGAAQQGSTESIQKQSQPSAGRDNVSQGLRQGPGEGHPGERHQSHPTERKEKHFLNHQHREYMKSQSKAKVEKHDSDTYILETGCFDFKKRKDMSISKDHRVKDPALKICGDGIKHSRMRSSTKLAFDGKEQEIGAENPMINPKQMASKTEGGKLGSKRHSSSSLAKEKGKMASKIEHLKLGEEKSSASKSSAKKKKTDHHNRAHNEIKPSSVPAVDGPSLLKGSEKGQQQPKMPSLYQELCGLAEIDNTKGDYFLSKSNHPRSLAPSSRAKAFCLAKSDDAWLNRNTRAASTAGSTIGSNSGILWSEGNKFQEYTCPNRSVKSKYLSSAKRASQKPLGLIKKAILNAQRSSRPKFSSKLKLVSAKP